MGSYTTNDILFKISLPLSIAIGSSKRKKFILNLNNFRNLHYRSLNNCKRNYADIVSALCGDHPPRIPSDVVVIAIYIYYAPTKRLVDIANPCSVLDKFTCDAIVKRGVLTDDSVKHLREVRYVYGGVDRVNPRCDLYLARWHPGEYNFLANQ